MASFPRLKALPKPHEQAFIDTIRKIREKRLTKREELPDLPKDLGEKAVALLTAMNDFEEKGFWQAYDALSEDSLPLRQWKETIETIAPPDQKAPTVRKYRPLRVSEILAMPEQEWIINNILYDDAISVVYSMPGVGKSFLGIDWSLRLALGWDWLGHSVKKCRVVYVAAEGARGYKKRINAWCYHQKVNPSLLEDSLVFIPRAIPLINMAEVSECIEDINTCLEETSDTAPLVIVLDTIFQCAAGMNINQTDVMSNLFTAIKQIKEETNACHILCMHHSGKDKERGMSGNMLLKANADIVYKLEEDTTGVITLSSEKVKDDEKISLYFKLEKVIYGEGERDTSLVVISAEKPRKDLHTDDAVRKMLAVLPRTLPGFTFTDWLDAVHTRFDPPGSIKYGVSRMTFNRRRDQVVADGSVCNVGTESKPVYIFAPDLEEREARNDE